MKITKTLTAALALGLSATAGVAETCAPDDMKCLERTLPPAVYACVVKKFAEIEDQVIADMNMARASLIDECKDEAK